MANKGKKLHYCPDCNRKRYFEFVVHGPKKGVKTCSKGHAYEYLLGTLDNLNEIVKQTLLPKLMDQMFRDDPFLAYIK